MIRVGVIGTSAWTERMYIRGLADHPDGAVTAVCGRDLEKTRAFAEKHGIARFDTDYRALLDSGEIDAVVISTPNDTHYPMTMHALKNGLHVMCEKPVALNYAQADAMATEAERRGLVHLTAFTYNYFPHFRYIAQLVRDGFIGKPFHLNLRYYSNYVFSENHTPWRFDRAHGGEGALFDIGSHAVALVRDIFGEIVAVSTQISTHYAAEAIPKERQASDAAVLTLRFASGASGVVDINMASRQPSVGGQKQALDATGSTGMLHYENDFRTTFKLVGAQADDEAARDLHVPDGVWPAGVSRDNPRDMYGDLYTVADTMARDFVSAIAEGNAPNGLTLRDGAEVQRVLDAAVTSSREDGRTVQL